MSIKKYIASKDTTITNAYKMDLVNRAENSNIGSSDSLEIFSLFGQQSTNSVEKSRILIQFPIDEIIRDRSLSTVPASGSTQFFLKISNVEHPLSLPKDYTILVCPLSKSWEEGYGLDLENYLDEGYPYGYGATWLTASVSSSWTTPGGDILSSENYTYNLITGLEDIEINITSLVEKWINGTIPNNGILIKLSGTFEDGSRERSFYTKRFSSRTSEYFYKRPSIDARWESFIQDDRSNFYKYNFALSDDDNKMNIYFYNKVRGKLKNIVNNILPDVKFYSDPNFTNEITSSFKNVTNPSAGVYKATIILNTTSSIVYDKWYNTSSSGIYFSDSFDILERKNFNNNNNEEYVINITNLKSVYSQNEQAVFKIFCRYKDWSPNIYSVANDSIENLVLNNLYYKIFRLNDNYTIIDYSTGSVAFSKTSYDYNGNYFEYDMKNIEKNYSYGVKLALYDGVVLKEFSPTFKFRVE